MQSKLVLKNLSLVFKNLNLFLLISHVILITYRRINDCVGIQYYSLQYKKQEDIFTLDQSSTHGPNISVNYADGQRAKTVRPEHLIPLSSTAFLKIFHSNLGSACKLCQNGSLQILMSCMHVDCTLWVHNGFSIKTIGCVPSTLEHSQTSAQTLTLASFCSLSLNFNTLFFMVI